MREHFRDVRDFLAEQGAAEIRFEHAGKHPRVWFEWQGRERFCVLPGSPGDTLRGGKNAISDLRHMLGVVPAQKRVGERRKRTVRRAVMRPQCPILTPPKGWMTGLYAHPTLRPMLPALLDEAWRNLWRDAMRQVGGVSRI